MVRIDGNNVEVDIFTQYIGKYELTYFFLEKVYYMK